MKEFLSSLDWMTLLSAIWTVILVPVGTQFYKYLQSKKLDKYGVILYEDIQALNSVVYRSLKEANTDFNDYLDSLIGTALYDVKHEK